MAFLFIDDGSPEANDCADNYVWFDAGNPLSVRRAMALHDAAAEPSVAPEAAARRARASRPPT